MENAVFVSFCDIKEPIAKIKPADILLYRGNGRRCQLNVRSNGMATLRKIGNTVFVVTASFSDTASETVEDMLVRYVSGQIAKEVKNSAITT